MRRLTYVLLDLTCCGEVVARFDLMIEPDDARPAVHADVSFVYETAPGMEEDSDVPFVQSGTSFFLSEPSALPIKFHVECPSCNLPNVQLTEDTLLDLLRPIRDAYSAGVGPQTLTIPVQRVGGLHGHK